MADATSTSPEKKALLAYLNGSRKHILDIVDGLSDEDLRRSVLPSGWNAVGLIQHLALDVERWWFRAVIAGEKDAIAYFDDFPDGWKVGDDIPTTATFGLYRDEIASADEIINNVDLDAPLTWWPADFGTPPVKNVREVILHVLQETAAHSGHLDAVRELIDGRQWLVLD
jgi:hypothetical protein